MSDGIECYEKNKAGEYDRGLQRLRLQFLKSGLGRSSGKVTFDQRLEWGLSSLKNTFATSSYQFFFLMKKTKAKN